MSDVVRRYTVATWWERQAGPAVAVGVFWEPDTATLQELRGRAVSEVATTSAEGADAMTVEWRADCGYTKGRKARIERELKRAHGRLQDLVADGFFRHPNDGPGEVRTCEG